MANSSSELDPARRVQLCSSIGSSAAVVGAIRSAAVSALTRNQVIAFVLAAAICFLFLMSGLELVQAMEKRILEKVWRIQGLWYARIEVRSAQIRNYEPQPSHWMNRRFEDVWLAQ